MARVLLLVHRLPFPPNKGDKVRSYHLLRHLAERHEVYLGTFVDDADDLRHVDTVRGWCAELRAERLRPGLARLACLRGLPLGEPLTQTYYRSRAMQHWVASVRDRVRPQVVVAFSSSMVQYARMVDAPLLMDLVDLDSEKWASYARTGSRPARWVYGREARRLLSVEIEAVRMARFACFVSAREAELFRQRAGDRAGPVHVVGNGVDADVFDPALPHADPYPSGSVPLVFTGAMDYAPNVDAVQWFCTAVWPQLLATCPDLLLYVVGRHPVPAVTRLAGPRVVVTGAVEDVRPYLAHAAVAVAPMRLARGVHNKILEAMAMGRPVVTSTAAAIALEPPLRAAVREADGAAAQVAAIRGLIEAPAAAADLGRRARESVSRHARWADRMSAFDTPLQACLTLENP